MTRSRWRCRIRAARLALAAPASFALVLGACSSSSRTTDIGAPAIVTTSIVAPATTSAGRGTLVGFHEVRAIVTGADGVTHELCFLVADTEALRASGLMGVTSLPGHDGMVFRFGAEQSAQFYMFKTLVALDIAFYDGAGAFVSGAAMTPCTSSNESACPRYGAGKPYADAVELFAGGAVQHGLLAGSRLALGGDCPPLPAA